MRHATAILLLVLWSVIGTLAQAIEIGDPAPVWEGLVGVDGKEHNLADLKSAKAIVVCITCNHCPVAIAYQDRLIQFAKDYKSKGVVLVAINVNNLEEDKLPAMKVRAKEKGFNFAYLYDPSQKIGRDLGAIVTPHVFLLDRDRKVAYMGAIDDSMDAKKAEKHFLRAAVDAVLSGGTLETPVTKPQGCGIKYEKRG